MSANLTFPEIKNDQFKELFNCWVKDTKYPTIEKEFYSKQLNGMRSAATSLQDMQSNYFDLHKIAANKGIYLTIRPPVIPTGHCPKIEKVAEDFFSKCCAQPELRKEFIQWSQTSKEFPAMNNRQIFYDAWLKQKNVDTTPLPWLRPFSEWSSTFNSKHPLREKFLGEFALSLDKKFILHFEE